MNMKRNYAQKYSFHVHFFPFCAFCIECVFEVSKMNIVESNRTIKTSVVVVAISL